MRLTLLSVVTAALAGSAVWYAVARSRAVPRASRTLLLTGFGPFGDHATNPAWEGARVLDGEVVGGTLVRTARIDVVYERAGEQLASAIELVRPDAVLCLGVAPGDRLLVEVVARNLDDCSQPDNEGVVRNGAPIRVGGPALLPTRLPVRRLVEDLAAGGYEIGTSEDAGGYLCNHLFYRLMDTWPEPRVAGFVHVPVLEGAWDLERLRSAVRRLVEVLDAAAGS